MNATPYVERRFPACNCVECLDDSNPLPLVWIVPPEAPRDVVTVTTTEAL
jgi:hypothetical protein